MAAQGNNKGESKRNELIAKARAEEQRAARLRKILIGTVVLILVAAVAGVIGLIEHNKSQQSAPVASGSTLAPVWSGLTGQTVDGVSADVTEHLAYHEHAHLAIYVNGAEMTVPGGVGITTPWQTQAQPNGSVWIAGGSHFYYLHTHTTDGIIHMESPTDATYTLGQFFAEWNQPLSADQVGPNKGTVTVYVNGAKFSSDPAGIVLKPHTVIQLDVGKDVAPAPYTFASGL